MNTDTETPEDVNTEAEILNTEDENTDTKTLNTEDVKDLNTPFLVLEEFLFLLYHTLHTAHSCVCAGV